MHDMQRKLDYADAIADWLLDIAEAGTMRGDLETGLRCTYGAANILCKQNRTLTSVRLESNLRSIAERLAGQRAATADASQKTERKEVCLHVLSEALPVGGITSLLLRWMKNDRSGRIHSIAVLSNRLPVPDELVCAVDQSGGSIYIADPDDTMLRKAIWLKNLANELAVCVVLHIDVSDVICGAAFGAAGGPPVLLINYNAHIFWTGASIADLVVNIRGSALEETWTGISRGIARYATIPIPLPEQDRPHAERTPPVEQKREAKKRLGMDADVIVILTVGASFKYLPNNGMDFIEVCEKILQRVPNAFVLAIGFNADDRWQDAHKRSGSRIRALGTVSQARLSLVHEATDVYVEGFPFGTTTSLLEAGLKSIPVVLAPAQCPPPYGSDGVALDDILTRPATLADYEQQVVRLCRDPHERSIQGERIRRSVARHHAGSGWQWYLEKALRKLPHEHAPQHKIAPIRTPDAAHEYWSTFVEQWGSRYEESLETAMDLVLSFGIRPRLSAAVLRACRDHRLLRQHRTIPLPLLSFLCDVLFPLLPLAACRRIFRLSSFLCRASLLNRVWNKITRLVRRTGRLRPWYDEYRQLHTSWKSPGAGAAEG